MDCKILLGVLFFSCVAFLHITGQTDGCRPGIVRNVRLSTNSTLTWEPPLSESCDIDYYVVYVSLLNSDPSQTWTYFVNERSLDLSSLEACQRYSFQITQVTTENVTGSPGIVNSVTPPPSEANLEIKYLNLTTSVRNILLNWALDEEWSSCAQHYRVVLYNEDDDTATDLYTSLNSLTISNLIPCAAYTITVRAIFNLEEEGPPYVVRHDAPEFVTNTPTLLSYDVLSDTINLTFRLQTLQNNRCPIYSLDINASPWFNRSFPITDQNSRTPISIGLTDLTPDSLYYLRVTANNSAGVTLPFQVAFQTREN
ncbi:hypothetical protein NQ317_012788 [Molorchus minor]|uniref:Fibronectin type-III domain-containing protein n=1 Tax=Molorchus minor TaxID=1323400 RepID=A0ABQ9K507_9CUCU|nr:hypothetical protein NQ317_012788 [Molorchus minor]